MRGGGWCQTGDGALWQSSAQYLCCSTGSSLAGLAQKGPIAGSAAALDELGYGSHGVSASTNLSRAGRHRGMSPISPAIRGSKSEALSENSAETLPLPSPLQTSSAPPSWIPVRGKRPKRWQCGSVRQVPVVGSKLLSSSFRRGVRALRPVPQNEDVCIFARCVVIEGRQGFGCWLN